MLQERRRGREREGRERGGERERGKQTIMYKPMRRIQVRGKIQPRTAHEVPEGDEIYRATLFVNLSAKWGWVVKFTARPFYHPRKETR
jgi:hypothetical protein